MHRTPPRTTPARLASSALTTACWGQQLSEGKSPAGAVVQSHTGSRHRLTLCRSATVTAAPPAPIPVGDGCPPRRAVPTAPFNSSCRAWSGRGGTTGCSNIRAAGPPAEGRRPPAYCVGVPFQRLRRGRCRQALSQEQDGATSLLRPGASAPGSSADVLDFHLPLFLERPRRPSRPIISALHCQYTPGPAPPHVR